MSNVDTRIDLLSHIRLPDEFLQSADWGEMLSDLSSPHTIANILEVAIHEIGEKPELFENIVATLSVYFNGTLLSQLVARISARVFKVAHDHIVELESNLKEDQEVPQPMS